MELFSSFFFRTLHVYIVNFNHFSLNLNDRDQLLYLVNFNYINNFLLQKLCQIGINLSLKFGVFEVYLSELTSQQVDQMLSSGILNWHLNHFVIIWVHFNKNVAHWYLECHHFFTLKKFEQIVNLSRKTKSKIRLFQLCDNISKYCSSYCKILSESFVLKSKSKNVKRPPHFLVKFSLSHVVEEPFDYPFHFKVSKAILLIDQSLKLSEKLHNSSLVFGILG